MSSFQETINIIKNYLSTDFSFYFINNKEMHSKIKKAVDELEPKVNEAITFNNEKEISIAHQTVTDIKEILDYFNYKIVLTKIDDNFKNFIEHCLLLFSNWNKIVQEEEISTKIAISKELLNFQQSMVNTVYVLQELLNEYEKIKQFSPPSFEISEHYLQELEKKIDDKEREKKEGE